MHKAQMLEKYSSDYQKVNIPPNAVVYCDPPYKNTSGYGFSFDHDRFYEWLRATDFPVSVSEYSMPEDFAEIWQIQKTCTYSSKGGNKKTLEKIFVHKKWLDKCRQEAGFLM